MKDNTHPHPQHLRAALYARVSSEQQAQQGTIASQVEALQQRIGADGLTLEDELYFLDDGYSGSTLVRPALERLRDVAWAGGFQRLYVQSPDRLARKYAWQVLLVEELQRSGVELVFLNRTLGVSPEEDLLLQMQGMMAEYERAKIMERSRRGKRYAARRGSVNVLGAAPYGYRYLRKHEGDGQAQYRVVVEEARVVKQIFTWVGRDRLTIREVCRRLQKQGIRSAKGKRWQPATVQALLSNPAYKGTAVFGKTRVGERRPRLRARRDTPEQPRHSASRYPGAPEEQITIPVPAIVSEELFEAVAEQLAHNQKARAAAKRRPALPPPRADRMWLLWLCLVRQRPHTLPEERQYLLPVLSLYRQGCLPLRRSTDLCQPAGASGSTRRDGVGGRLRGTAQSPGGAPRV